MNSQTWALWHVGVDGPHLHAFCILIHLYPRYPMHYKSSQWHPTLLSRLCRSHPTTLDLSAQYKPTKPGGMGLVGVGLHCIRPCLKETPIDRFPAEEIQICHAEKFIALLSTHIRQMSSRPQHLSWGQEPLVDSGVATQLCGTSIHTCHISYHMLVLHPNIFMISRFFHNKVCPKPLHQYQWRVQRCPPMNTGKGVPSVSTRPATPWFTPP